MWLDIPRREEHNDVQIILPVFLVQELVAKDYFVQNGHFDLCNL